MSDTGITRRAFLRVLGGAGAGLVVGIYLGGCEESGSTTTVTSGLGGTSTTAATTTTVTTTPILPESTLAPNIYLSVAGDGSVTVTAFRSEMGQGIRTAIAMILVEELDAAWESVVIEHAPADPQFGDQVTGGSQSISTVYSALRQAGAATRWMLVEAAAQEWEVAHDECATQPGLVIHPDGERSLDYGLLAGLASRLDPPEADQYTLKEESQFRIIGSTVHHFDGPEIVTGGAVYGSDVRVPGMVFATIARSPTFDGSAIGFDAAEALATEGVLDVFRIDGSVVVVASNTWAALKGRRALTVDWDLGPNVELSSEAMWSGMEERQTATPDADEIDATYRIPYQAHMTMEPMNCVADVRADHAEVWAPTQNPQRVRAVVAARVGLPEEDVTVHVPLIGGGFGRRLEPDYAIEAARVSHSIGRPVQVVWTREDDVRHDHYHPLLYQYVRGVPGVDERPRTQNMSPGSYVPTGAWRSVTNHHDAFVVQCFIDEMAQALGMDTLEFRRQRYGGTALGVIELAAEKAGWGESLREGWGRGIAFHSLFGVTDVAMVAEVEVSQERLAVRRIVAAVDCGQVVNPGNVVAQIESGVAFGLTAALKGGVTLEQGQIKESNFHDSPILLMSEMPDVEVHLIESNEPPSGIGEAGVPPVAPAVVNAVFAATGKRVRTLPIDVAEL